MREVVRCPEASQSCPCRATRPVAPKRGRPGGKSAGSPCGASGPPEHQPPLRRAPPGSRARHAPPLQARPTVSAATVTFGALGSLVEPGVRQLAMNLRGNAAWASRRPGQLTLAQGTAHGIGSRAARSHPSAGRASDEGERVCGATQDAIWSQSAAPPGRLLETGLRQLGFWMCPWSPLFLAVYVMAVCAWVLLLRTARVHVLWVLLAWVTDDVTC